MSKKHLKSTIILLACISGILLFSAFLTAAGHAVQHEEFAMSEALRNREFAPPGQNWCGEFRAKLFGSNCYVQTFYSGYEREPRNWTANCGPPLANDTDCTRTCKSALSANYSNGGRILTDEYGWFAGGSEHALGTECVCGPPSISACASNQRPTCPDYDRNPSL
jgi:hypothetical protein